MSKPKVSKKPVLSPIPSMRKVVGQVDFLLVEHEKHPAMEALDLLPQVGILLGKVLGNVPGLSLSSLMDPTQDLSRFGPAISVVFLELRDMERQQFTLDILRYTRVEAAGLNMTYLDSQDKVTTYFGDNLLTLLKVLFGAMKQTFGNFIDADFVKSLVKTDSAKAKESPSN